MAASTISCGGVMRFCGARNRRWRAPVLDVGPPAPGLSLIELLFALAILGVIAAIAVPNYRQYVYQARVVQATADLRRIEQGLEGFAIGNDGAYPASLAEVGLDGMRDPWGHAYRYLNIALASNPAALRKDKNLVPINTDYDLYSMGRDGATLPPLTAPSSRDDVIRANNGAFRGLAAEY